MSIGISDVLGVCFPHNHHVITRDKYRMKFVLAAAMRSEIRSTIKSFTNAHFSVASDTNFTQSCAANDLQCECDDHITFGEPPYDGKSAERKWCGKLPQTFRSNGRVLVITYAYSGGQQNAFSLTYSTESEWNGDGHSGRQHLPKQFAFII